MAKNETTNGTGSEPAAKKEPATKFEAKLSVSAQADKCMNDSAIAQKIHPGIIYRSRDTTIKVKVGACKAIDKDLEERKPGKEEKAFWAAVKQDLAVR